VIYKVMIINNDLDIIEYDENYDQQNIKEYLYYAVTNRHVIENSSYIKVYIGSKDKEYDASLVAFDDKTDLAVVSFKFNEYFEPLLFGNTSDIKSGTFVIALGNPNGTEYFGTSTLGIVSYPKRYINDDLDGDGIGDWHSEYIQHDGAINHGNSGGPLLNLRGEIIGINTLKMVADSIESMGFAIPSHIITPQLSTLENGQTPVRASFGLVAMTVKEILERDDNLYEIPEGIDYGVYVTTVNPDSVGANALIEPGDIILRLNEIDLIYIYQVRIELGKVVVGNNQTLTASVYKKTTSQIETVEFIFP
ncbi:MAG: trypsin-like peptidase domain-containing protein, partial [Bacilli bacterium]|nr:trypsin-like peptidase domain-containing protein [Bacilli bacterium]